MHSTILSGHFFLLICFNLAMHLSAQKLGRKYLSNQTYTHDELMASYNAFTQLYWIYKKTPYCEKEHMRNPVFRIY